MSRSLDSFETCVVCFAGWCGCRARLDLQSRSIRVGPRCRGKLGQDCSTSPAPVAMGFTRPIVRHASSHSRESEVDPERTRTKADRPCINASIGSGIGLQSGTFRAPSALASTGTLPRPRSSSDPASATTRYLFFCDTPRDGETCSCHAGLEGRPGMVRACASLPRGTCTCSKRRGGIAYRSPIPNSHDGTRLQPTRNQKRPTHLRSIMDLYPCPSSLDPWLGLESADAGNRLGDSHIQWQFDHALSSIAVAGHHR